MTIEYDGEKIEATPRLIAALEEVARAEVEMMANHFQNGCWTWGRCFIGDMAEGNCFSFMFGGDDDDFPDDGKRFAVEVEDFSTQSTIELSRQIE